ncbi:MAG: PilZ domain-containing protein [Nitrospiraceae bacterium]|nr:MAG: PilZ domain-containing protein [Nitrospiraceae bacterium]
MDERRSYQRYPVSLEVRLREVDGAPDADNATVVDVSFGGLAIVTERNMSLGTEVFVQWLNPPFYFAGDAVARAVVVSTRPEEGQNGRFRLGVKFKDGHSELAQSLLNWVQMQATRQRFSQPGRSFSGKGKKGF